MTTLPSHDDYSERRHAFVTGVHGQDGHYLSLLLLRKGYWVHGLDRAELPDEDERRDNPRFRSYVGSVGDMPCVLRVLALIAALGPARLEVYNLAAQTHVHDSFMSPWITTQTNALGVINVLEAIRAHPSLAGVARFMQASTSEMFGSSPAPQSEATPLRPCSPYGCSKAFGYWITRTYRDGLGMFACNCVAFNHESERRGKRFVTRKITRGVARILAGDARPLSLGNLEAARDWGYAPDYVRAMWLVLQQRDPEDYVVATGETHTVREFAEAAFQAAGVPLAWVGTRGSQDEKGIRTDTGQVVVVIDPELHRPLEVTALQGEADKLRSKTGWRPSLTFNELVAKMVRHDINTYFRGEHEHPS
jgi:GDPmannose 4,6-dehydratase